MYKVFTKLRKSLKVLLWLPVASATVVKANVSDYIQF